MGIERFEDVPYKIRNAKVKGNKKYLSKAGTIGAEVANENSKHDKEEETRLAELAEEENLILAELAEEAAALEELDRMRATNEHILTPDGEPSEYILTPEDEDPSERD